MAAHIEKTSFKCVQCHFTCENQSKLNQHINQYHNTSTSSSEHLDAQVTQHTTTNIESMDISTDTPFSGIKFTNLGNENKNYINSTINALLSSHVIRNIIIPSVELNDNYYMNMLKDFLSSNNQCDAQNFKTTSILS